ncbi:response regulator transcription factor [Leucobacter viscericola]|uniref:Response regulator transcription factor n=1 Tax=Leucobacter viscericola TaxID=2714935 RepID=A0A6G7XGH8_9MICO|nr:response regulator transcription factor [Leucobacter viscericola]QIK63549.1 response regulator transcription factor [Leucobacter viscericola]
MIRVMLVDDQELVRSGFRIILESEPDIEVIAEAVNGEDAIAAAAKHTPDVICMDVEMPLLNGIEASRQILAEQPETGVLILTTFGHEQYLFDALAAGVSGFLLKTSRAEQLIDAVRTIAAGNALLGPDVTRAVIERVSADREAAPSAAVTAEGGSGSDTLKDAMDDARLTDREREVLSLVAEGKSNSEIAAELFLGEATVKTHVSNLLQKLGVRDRIQAVVWAHTQG